MKFDVFLLMFIKCKKTLNTILRLINLCLTLNSKR